MKKSEITRIGSQEIRVRPDGSLDIGTVNDEPSLTEQQYKDSCDINLIMKKYQLTGEITHLRRQQGMYADLTNVPSYQEALDLVIKAQDAFDTLPGAFRQELGNDPAKFLEWIHDPKNSERAIEMGLAERRPVNETPNANQPKNAKGKTKTQVPTPTQNPTAELEGAEPSES